MTSQIFEKGTIKVVWIEKENDHIFSKMFDDVSEAAQFGKTKEDYLIFKLLWQKNFKEFSWKILPFGNFKLYQKLIDLYKNHQDKIKQILKLIS